MARRLSSLILCCALLLSLLTGCVTETISQESLADTVGAGEETPEGPQIGEEIPVEEPAPEPEQPAADGPRCCPQCGAQVADDALFCNKCGAQL